MENFFIRNDDDDDFMEVSGLTTTDMEDSWDDEGEGNVQYLPDEDWNLILTINSPTLHSTVCVGDALVYINGDGTESLGLIQSIRRQPVQLPNGTVVMQSQVKIFQVYLRSYVEALYTPEKLQEFMINRRKYKGPRGLPLQREVYLSTEVRVILENQFKHKIHLYEGAQFEKLFTTDPCMKTRFLLHPTANPEQVYFWSMYLVSARVDPEGLTFPFTRPRKAALNTLVRFTGCGLTAPSIVEQSQAVTMFNKFKKNIHSPYKQAPHYPMKWKQKTRVVHESTPLPGGGTLEEEIEVIEKLLVPGNVLWQTYHLPAVLVQSLLASIQPTTKGPVCWTWKALAFTGRAQVDQVLFGLAPGCPGSLFKQDFDHLPGRPTSECSEEDFMASCVIKYNTASSVFSIRFLTRIFLRDNGIFLHPPASGPWNWHQQVHLDVFSNGHLVLEKVVAYEHWSLHAMRVAGIALAHVPRPELLGFPHGISDWYRCFEYQCEMPAAREEDVRGLDVLDVLVPAHETEDGAQVPAVYRVDILITAERLPGV